MLTIQEDYERRPLHLVVGLECGLVRWKAHPHHSMAENFIIGGGLARMRSFRGGALNSTCQNQIIPFFYIFIE